MEVVGIKVMEKKSKDDIEAMYFYFKTITLNLVPNLSHDLISFEFNG